VSVPTWTGRSGGAGLPRRFGSTLNPTIARASGPPRGAAGASSSSSSAGFFGQSQSSSSGPVGSASLLERIRERKEATGEADSAEAQASRLAQRLAEFIRRAGGRASSAQLVSEFQQMDVDARLLKNLLKQVAEKDASGSWKLRQGFNAP